LPWAICAGEPLAAVDYCALCHITQTAGIDAVYPEILAPNPAMGYFGPDTLVAAAGPAPTR
jgi:hypothetical protein